MTQTTTHTAWLKKTEPKSKQKILQLLCMSSTSTTLTTWRSRYGQSTFVSTIASTQMI
jgi:hypothetical protein